MTSIARCSALDWIGVSRSIVAVAGALLPVDCAARSAGAGPRRRSAAERRARARCVLAWADTRNGIAQHDFTSHALSVIERLGYESGAYDTFIRTDSNIVAKEPKRTTGEPASGGPNLRHGRRDLLPRASRRADRRAAEEGHSLAFVRDGKGFVAAHTALTAFESWPEFGELLGGRYDGHPWHAPGTVINEAADFPATQALSRRRSRSTTSSTRRRSSRRTRACCCGSMCRRCRRTPSCATRAFRSRGRRPTARAGCSIRRSRTTRPPGTTAMLRRCISKPSSGRSA